MIFEIRTYVVKSGMRERFLDLFERRTKPLQRSLGIGVIGPFVDLEKSDTFIWLRTFPSMEERDRMKDELYNGNVWKEELEDIAMSMLVSFDTALTTATEDLSGELSSIGKAADQKPQQKMTKAGF